ncbi:MAG: cytochrome C oxidase subunit IV family protein [Sulfurovum sp.]|jgi:hypothetical protein|nr:cytochrome C oxidase subunit IV family protein [Sulfurovum sp.]
MKKTLEIVWIVLALLTVFAFLLGYLKYINVFLVGILLVSTFIKALLVIDHFMGLKEVRLTYRIIPILWLSLTILLIATAYYLPVEAVR